MTFLISSYQFNRPIFQVIVEDGMQGVSLNSAEMILKNTILSDHNFSPTDPIPNIILSIDTYNPESPISIANNTDFNSTAYNKGWQGNGTKINPYIIKSLNITGPSSSNLIEIQDTNVYFKVLDCYLSSGVNAITLNNVSHCLISNNIITNCTDSAIFPQHCNDTIFCDNYLFKNSYDGFHLQYCENTTILNNTLTNGSIAIQVSDSRNTTIVKNNISYYNSDGIAVDSTFSIVSENVLRGCHIRVHVSSDYSVVEGNLINNYDSYGGIMLHSVQYCTIRNNTAYGGSHHGIDIEISPNNIFEKNKIHSNFFDGINIDNSRNCVFTDNVIFNHTQTGIVLLNSEECTFSNNQIFNCGSGFQLGKSMNLTISNNTVHGVSDGIRIHSGCDYSQIRNNTVFDASFGIKLETCGSSSISHNIIYDSNTRAIKLDNSKYNTISYNNISNTLDNSDSYGIHLYESDNGTLDNNMITNTIGYDTAGVYLQQSDYVNVSKNAIFKNNGRGIDLDHAINCHITNNIFYDNHGYAIKILGYYEGNNDVLWNDFISNHPEGLSQAYDDGTVNKFKNNYWDNWTTPDSNSDEIVDVPYSVKGGPNTDTQPLTAPINPSPIDYVSRPVILSPKAETVVNGTITIQWTASFDYSGHPVTYSVFYKDDDTVHPWIELESGLSSPSIDWDTTTSVYNNDQHYLKIVATCSQGISIIVITNWSFTIRNELSTTTATTTTTLSEESTAEKPLLPFLSPSYSIMVLLLSLITVMIIRRIREKSGER